MICREILEKYDILKLKFEFLISNLHFGFLLQEWAVPVLWFKSGPIKKQAMKILNLCELKATQKLCLRVPYLLHFYCLGFPSILSSKATAFWQ